MALSLQEAKESRTEYAGVVRDVMPGSIAAEVGIRPGYRLVRINDIVPEDLIDFRFAEADDHLVLHFYDEAGQEHLFDIEKDPGEYLGIAFASPLFDAVRECRNKCIFCFVDQLPEGMRQSLYVYDDDYRLSFLYGNFVTLTNLDEHALERILSMRLSPLYVSVHATDPQVRLRLLRNRKHADILPLLRRLIDGGIQLHTQVVVNPGINDGAVLEKTAWDLAELYPGVLSLGIVPVGLTGHRDGLPTVEAVSPDLAVRIIDRVSQLQTEFFRRLGSRFISAADEMFAIAGREVPPAEYYEDYPQLENGIGGSRLFLDQLEQLRGRRDSHTGASKLSCTLVTGHAATPLVRRLAEKLQTILPVTADVVTVENRWFGGHVNVAGLLTARDIRDHLQDRPVTDIVFVPSTCLKEGHLFLDDVTLPELSEQLGTEICGAHAFPEDLAEDLEGRCHLAESA